MAGHEITPPAFSLFSRDTIAGLRDAREEAAVAGDASSLHACTLADQAVSAADAGRMDEASKAIQALRTQTTDLRLLFLGFQFHFRRSQWADAEWFVRRRLELCRADSEDASRAWTNLGLIQHFRGEHAAAELSHRKAIEIDQALGNQPGVARDLGNLALIPESKGDLDLAEQMYREALAIAERVGAKAIIATKLTNLGEIAMTRGQRDEAKSLWTRAVGLFTELEDHKHRSEFARRLQELE